MCDENVGVAKRIDLEKVSKELAEFVKNLDHEVNVEVSVKDVKKIQKQLEGAIAGKTT